MGYNRVIVFGPTGNIGSVVAKRAHDLGAHVVLAMRNTEKAIRGIDKSSEQAGRYQRVQADFGDSASCEKAVKESGAKAAFLYLHHGNQDHQLSQFEALKAGGIEFVVFISSFTVQGDDISKIEPSDIISYLHAQAELNLAKVFGKSYVAIRPGGFVTNTLREAPMIRDGHVKLFHPENKMDWITPTDIGEVSGTILVQGPKDGQRIVYLFGAKPLPAGEVYETIGEVVNGKKAAIEPIATVEEAKNIYISAGVPPPIAGYLAQSTEDIANGTLKLEFSDELLSAGRKNVRTYLGREPLGFREWVKDHKDMYA